jgi:hypothetical protein
VAVPEGWRREMSWDFERRSLLFGYPGRDPCSPK